MPTDENVVMYPAITRGSDGEFAELFRAHEVSLLRYVARLTSSRDLAEDLVQETFAKLLKHGAPGMRSPRGLLFKTARHLVIDHYRRRAAATTDTVGDFESLQLSDASANPEAQVIAREGLSWLCQVLAELPTQQRRVFTLRKVYNLTHAEIADELGITISTAQKHLTKALAHVSAQVRDIKD